MQGYKQAIRDRMPKNWVFVLKYLGRLGAWIELVYATRFRPINGHWNKDQQRELKRKALKDLFANSFFYTLDELRMNEATYARWLSVNEWVNWFNQNWLYIKDFITHECRKDLLWSDKVEILANSKWCKQGDKPDVKLAEALLDYYFDENN